jgi:hypothetical protein
LSIPTVASLEPLPKVLLSWWTQWVGPYDTRSQEHLRETLFFIQTLYHSRLLMDLLTELLTDSR